jgi:hypothetical protein
MRSWTTGRHEIAEVCKISRSYCGGDVEEQDHFQDKSLELFMAHPVVLYRLHSPGVQE